MGKICSMCGKPFDIADEKNNFSFKGTVYEGSSYAGLVYNLNLCCGCFDKLAKYIVPQCNKEVFGINTDERDYDGESFDFIRRIRRIIPANNLEFAFRICRRTAGDALPRKKNRESVFSRQDNVNGAPL